MAEDTKQIEAIMGPYRGLRLTVTAADAEGAINDHWAIDPYKEAEPDAKHTEGQPLSEEERTHALEASRAWQQAQLAAAAGTEPDPPVRRRTTETRDMTAESGGSDYERRGPGRPPVRK